jgi:hypothetical protein
MLDLDSMRVQENALAPDQFDFVAHQLGQKIPVLRGDHFVDAVQESG